MPGAGPWGRWAVGLHPGPPPGQRQPGNSLAGLPGASTVTHPTGSAPGSSTGTASQKIP